MPKKAAGKGKKVTYEILFWLFMLGSVCGYFVEGIGCIIKKGHWEDHAATVWGPFCIVYGIGAAAIYLISILIKEKGVLLHFVLYAAAGSAVEYAASLFQELCFHSRSWNYSNQPFNIGGRVSLRMAVTWGALGIVFAYLVFPFLERLLTGMEGKAWRSACFVFSVFMAVNLLLTSMAVLRWRDRREEIPATNQITRFLDDTYDDAAMERLFSNMVFIR